MNRNKWQRVPAPNTRGAKMHGWVREMDEAYREVNGEYAVLVRTLNTKLGTVKHAAIRNATETDITWSEKQRIKMKFLERKNKRLNFSKTIRINR